ncbi:MAG: hypothetical protein ACK5JH_00770 [Anaerocolumna sp.]
MRRYNPPFNGNRYVLNKNTGEIHDLDNETPSCKISEIKSEHVINCISYEDAQLRAIFLTNKANGCYYCLRSKDNG